MLTRQAQRLCCFPCPCPYLFFFLWVVCSITRYHKSRCFKIQKQHPIIFMMRWLIFPASHPHGYRYRYNMIQLHVRSSGEICWCASQTELTVLSYFRLPIWGLVRKSVATWNCMMTHKLVNLPRQLRPNMTGTYRNKIWWGLNSITCRVAGAMFPTFYVLQ